MAKGVTPLAFSFSATSTSPAHVVGGVTFARSKASLRYHTSDLFEGQVQGVRATAR